MVRRTSVWLAAMVVTSGFVTVALAGPAHAAPIGAAVSSDYNGDGYGDVAFSELRTVNGLNHAGALRVAYGSASGITTSGSQLLTEDTPGIPGVVAAEQGFGRVIVSGNFDGDAYADVAVEAEEVATGTGAVVVLYGSASGLHGTPAAQAKAELLEAALYSPAYSPPLNPLGFWGEYMAVADFNLDGFADLAVGSPDAPNGGGISVIYGSPHGLYPAATVLWIDQDTPGVPGTPDANGDQFGSGLVAADFNGDGRPDLAVGAPAKDVAGLESPGEVVVLLTDANGLVTGTGALEFDLDTLGVPGDPTYHGHVGAILAAGNVTGDGKADLIVPAVGSILVFPGSPTGPTVTGIQAVDNTGPDHGITSLTVINTDGSTFGDLAVGEPRRTVSGLTNAGAVIVLPGSFTGLNTAAAQTWTQDTAGVLDVAESGDFFGNSVRAVQNTGANTDNLVIGVMLESTTPPKCVQCGALSELFGAFHSGLTATGNLFIPATSLTGGGFTYGYFANSLG
jgi:hypothetical protein